MTQCSVQMTEERGLSEDDRSVCHIPKERERQAEFETPTNARIQATLTKKGSEENPSSSVLAHTLNLNLVHTRILHFVDMCRLHCWQLQICLLKPPF
jgi:hypothetical protein